MPLLEVRRCGAGHPPFTERERVIRLNGTSGVIFLRKAWMFFRAFLFWKQTFNAQRFKAERFLVERWALSVERWAFLIW
jgi:hypothetical protein